MRTTNRRGVSILTKLQVFAFSVLIAQSLLVLILLNRLHTSTKKIHSILEDHEIENLSLPKCNPVRIDDEKAVNNDSCHYRATRTKDMLGHNSSAWDVIDGNMSYSGKIDFVCENKFCRSSWEAELNETKQLAYFSIKNNMERKPTDWKLDSIEFSTAFVRVNQIVGLEYLFHTTLNLRNAEELENTGNHQIRGSSVIRKKFSPELCDVTFHENDLQHKADPIHIVVPYTGRPEQLRIFLGNIIKLISERVSIRLILAVHETERDTEDVKNLFEELKIADLVEGPSREPVARVIEVSGDKQGKFSRSVALLNGLEHAPGDALVFYCDVDMKLRKGFFENCRHNAWRNEQVYYPTIYSLYPYGTQVKEGHGYWRTSSYGMICAYKEDLMRNTFWKDYAEYLTGWGGEDTILYGGFNIDPQISIFRAPEPNLLHRWHPKHCEWNYFVGSCLNTVFENLGSKRFLGWIVAGHGIDVRSLNYEPGSFKGFGGYDENNATHHHEENTDAEKYENFVKSGKAGLLSTFALEAASETARIQTDK